MNDTMQEIQRARLRLSLLYLRPFVSAKTEPLSGEVLSQLKTCAEGGDAEASYLLGLYYTFEKSAENLPVGLQWLRRAAEQGSGDACMVLGDLYDSHRDGRTIAAKDDVTAFRYYKKAAQLGESECFFDVGLAYQYGIGTAEDPDQAAYWLQRAVAAGDEQAYGPLGLCYLEGEGVPQDVRKGEALLLKAPDPEKVRLLLGNIYSGIYGEQYADLEKAERCYAPDLDDPALRGQRLAALSNAASYCGDAAKQQHYLRLSAQAGYEPAQRFLREQSAPSPSGPSHSGGSTDSSGSSGGGKVLIAVLIFVAFVLLKILFS